MVAALHLPIPGIRRIARYVVLGSLVAGSMASSVFATPSSPSSEALDAPSVATSPANPDAVAEPALQADPHITRHVMKPPGAREQAREVDRLNKQIESLKAELDNLAPGADLDAQHRLEASIMKTETRLKALEFRKELEKREPVDLPDGSIFSPRATGRSIVVSSDGRVSFMNHIYIEDHEVVEESAIAILGDVHVGGEVQEAVVSLGGDVYVTGTVTHEVIAPLGNVYLGERAIVEGDIFAMDVFADQGALIDGNVHLVNIPFLRVHGNGADLLYPMLILFSVLSGMAILLGLLVQVAAPGNVNRVETRIRNSPVGVFLGGILVQVLSLPVFTLLVVTIIGIPVAFLVLPLVLAAAMLLGIVATSRMLGEALIRREGDPRRTTLSFVTGAILFVIPLLMGLAMIAPFQTAADTTGATIVGFLGKSAVFLGVALLYISSTAGLGAAVVSRLGFRDRNSRVRKPATHEAGTPPPPHAAPLPPSNPNAT